MKYLNKMTFFLAALGLLLMTSCEGGDIYTVDAPGWLAEMSSEEEEPEPEEELVGQMEDVYNIGNAEFTAGFFTLGKTYIVPAGAKWQAQFNLTVNPDNKYYKNFYIVLNACDETAADFLGAEYGVIRYDNDPSKNSEWNTIGTEIDRSLVGGNFTNSSPTEGENQDVDASVQKLNGKITLTVDRTDGGLFIKMTNGSMTKTYTQTKSFPSTGSDANICCRIGIEQSLVSFLSTNIEPIGGCTSAADKEPATLQLINVPDEVDLGTSLEDAFANVRAIVSFEGSPDTKEVTAADLNFTVIPDMETLGEKSLVVTYSKTFKGVNASAPAVALVKFNVVKVIESIEVTKAPTNTTYYFYNSFASEGIDRDMAFNPVGMEVTATYGDGTKEVVDNSKLSFSTVPAEAGTYNVTVTTKNGRTATVSGISVAESEATLKHLSPTKLGAEDNSTPWWSAFTEDVKVPAGATYQVNFTNYAGGSNWNNFVIILRNAAMAEYSVVRADNYGWGNGYAAAMVGPGQNWGAWLPAMNGAECTAYITNCANGTADVQVIMNGNDGNTYIQYYLGINTVDAGDLQFAFTVDGSHIVFE